MGGPGDDSGRVIATDRDGNSTIAGWFREKARFGSTTLTAANKRDIFVARLDSSGKVKWVRQISGIGKTVVHDIAVDGSRNTYLVGGFGHEIRIGSTVLTAPRADQIFVVKIGPSGKFLWAKHAGGKTDSYATNIAVDSNGNGILIGWMKGGRLGIRQFTAKPRVVVRMVSAISFGSSKLDCTAPAMCVFQAKLDSSGRFVSAKRVATSTWSLDTRGIAHDAANGELLIAGRFVGTAVFGHQTIKNAGHPDRDIYLARLSSTGKALWIKHLPKTSGADIRGVAVDPGNNIYIAGSFRRSIQLGGETLRSSDGREMFIARLGSSGKVLWARQSVDSEGTAPHALVTDHLGNVHVVGYFREKSTLGTTRMASAGASSSVFVAKLSATGTLLSAWHPRGDGASMGHDIDVDRLGDAHVVGDFCSTVKVDSRPFSATGSRDVLFVRLGASDKPTQ